MLLQKPSTEANKLANSQGRMSPRRSERKSIDKDSCFPPNAKTLIFPCHIKQYMASHSCKCLH